MRIWSLLDPTCPIPPLSPTSSNFPMAHIAPHSSRVEGSGGETVPPSKINYLRSVSVRSGICFGSVGFACNPYMKHYETHLGVYIPSVFLFKSHSHPCNPHQSTTFQFRAIVRQWTFLQASRRLQVSWLRCLHGTRMKRRPTFLSCNARWSSTDRESLCLWSALTQSIPQQRRKGKQLLQQSLQLSTMDEKGQRARNATVKTPSTFAFMAQATSRP